MINQHSIISYFVKNPKAIFLFDSIGAFISAICLLIISRYYSDYFGINHSTFQLLAILPIVFCIYSACCFLFVKRSYKPFILIIAIANFLYCLITLVFISYFFTAISILGLSYFILEIIVIAYIVYLEFTVAFKCQI
ncbi:MAG: hypothetical protein C0446_12510 [Chitinophaga sp.]|nr:hypothetical protein [Chitinophaga sp.]